VKFQATSLEGLLLVELERHRDERGWFAHTFGRDELRRQGIEMDVAQGSASYNDKAGTLRGLHYQDHPHQEQKLVRCTRGAIFDVAVDIRAGSPTRGRWFGLELSAEEPRMLYIPTGFAHGFQTLTDSTEVSYLISPGYVPEAARGVHWDDPSLAIDWPPADRIISGRDRGLPPLEP
jgi:dTDP-4-dehydrorhamnose 3,5-epimerase